ncbi:hypothetical protein PM082_018995 [Marasmius tenuissimus]|nr:hypothetical protein PM082_018995 [Marasmius tenuissimus]
MATTRHSNSKRRRLSSPKNTSSTTKPTPGTVLYRPTGTTRFTCVSCRRALNASTNITPSSPVFCAICNSPSCTICSRTCTGDDAEAEVTQSPVHSLSEFGQDSAPETPHLTWSPSSPISTPSPPSLVASPRRFALALNAANTNTGNFFGHNQAPGKRKKHGDDGGEASAGEGANKGSGCGRVVCKNCCLESSNRFVAGVVVAFHLSLSDFYDSTACIECSRA